MTWTSRSETIVSTVMVMILATLAMLFFWGVDSIISWVVQFLLSFGAS